MKERAYKKEALDNVGICESTCFNCFRFKCGLQIIDRDRRQVHTNLVNIPLKTRPTKTKHKESKTGQAYTLPYK